MDIKRLTLFCRIVELKSFTRAAEAVHLSQPSVSEQLRLLEESVGERLLDRMGREVVPTPAGRKLYPYARQILQLREEARQAMATFRGELAGTLSIGASTIPGTYILPGVIQQFRQQYPACRVSIRTAGSGAIVQGVLEGDYEFGLTGSRFREARCAFEPLWDDQLAVILPVGHPLAGLPELPPEQLGNLPFVQREVDSGTRVFSETALREAGCDPGSLRIVAEFGSNEAVRQAVLAGLGAGILSLRAVASELDRGELVALPIRGTRMRRSFYLVLRRKRQLSPLAEAFLSHMRKAANSAPEI
ncbi:selenium metabolism-associated LysR family transcriptional regulator [Geothermobacter hydrogeniphilus]|uniref:LysR family transcriptional regulator n=1 Tax=Geothermobacter hydrogeniphilus TaxID=1969733 RepID=A0A1X0Y353_9BACT|nr:selenium metabolism-associated LysR family transcriptional regulator [Geothermobacter hydrogeniphilus]ORJ59576.1 LysR family transcriptional regulator [Geothermobacter hydrogeniphilus]